MNAKKIITVRGLGDIAQSMRICAYRARMKRDAEIVPRERELWDREAATWERAAEMVEMVRIHNPREGHTWRGLRGPQK